jgi:XapX domain-containing protein
MATGVLVGIIYALLEVRSPAPPVVALVSLRWLAGEPIDIGWLETDCAPRAFGELAAKPKTVIVTDRELRT